MTRLVSTHANLRTGGSTLRCFGRACAPKASDDSGQAMVEFALVVPLILLLLFGMLQFALVLDARQTVAYAAQAAANSYAQTLARQRGEAEAASAGAQMRPEFAKVGKVSYTLIRGANESTIALDGTGTFGDFVAARATYDYPSPIRARLGPFQFPASFSLSAEAVARIEAADGTVAGGSTASVPALAPRATPVATPRPTPTPTPRPTPGPTATPAPVARCFTFSGGVSVNVQGATGQVLVDGMSGPRSFSPGSTHWVSAYYTVESSYQQARTIRGRFGRSRTEYLTVRDTVTRQATGQFTVPSAGTVGGQYSATASFGGTGNAVIRLTGAAGGC